MKVDTSTENCVKPNTDINPRSTFLFVKSFSVGEQILSFLGILYALARTCQIHDTRAPCDLVRRFVQPYSVL
jgi:hypothetical protein